MLFRKHWRLWWTNIADRSIILKLTSYWNFSFSMLFMPLSSCHVFLRCNGLIIGQMNACQECLMLVNGCRQTVIDRYWGDVTQEPDSYTLDKRGQQLDRLVSSEKIYIWRDHMSVYQDWCSATKMFQVKMTNYIQKCNVLDYISCPILFQTSTK